MEDCRNQNGAEAGSTEIDKHACMECEYEYVMCVSIVIFVGIPSNVKKILWLFHFHRLSLCVCQNRLHIQFHAYIKLHAKA